MARTHQGQTLTQLELQPGATWTQNEQGFDAGRKEFWVSTEYAELRTPAIHSPDSDRKTMYVTAVETEDMENGLSKLSVTYSGIYGANKTKPTQISLAVGSQDETLTLINGNPARCIIPIPTVSHVWVSKSRPRTDQIGQIKLPPGIKSDEFSLAKLYFIQYINPLSVLFSDWLLSSRDLKQAGPLWEVSDTYTWRIIKSEE
jgi:DMSO/TMAO reductase YedYZ molybdopterin-dependent catalytic subunit